jgi:hypothetical protein
MECWMCFLGAITPDTHTFTIFGTAINPKVIVNPWIALCKYTGGVWYVVYFNMVGKTGDGGSITTDANGNLIIKAGGVTNTMLAGSITYANLLLTGAILSADLAGSVAWNKMLALTASRLMGTDGGGVAIPLDTATYPSLGEIALIKGLTGASLQTQLAAIVSTFSSYTTSSDLSTLLGSYSSTTAMNAAIAAGLLTVKPLVGKGSLGAGTTTLDATALDYYLVGTATGAATINLPISDDKADGFVLTIKLTGGNTATSVIQTQSSNVLTSAINTSVANLTGMGNGSWYKLRNHKGTGAAGSWEIMEYVTI